MQIACAVMTVLFVFGAAVQYNDPDPIQWMAVYLAAAAVSAVVAIRHGVPRWAPLAIGAIALVWGLVVSTDVPDVATYERMFDSWEMSSITVEEARETSGLLIITAWMAVLAWRAPHRR